jgi:hypothetical protein
MDNPRLRVVGGTLYFTWDEGVGVRMERLKNNSAGDPQAEITVRLLEPQGPHKKGKVIGPRRIVLTSDSGLTGLLRTLVKRVPDPLIGWDKVVEHAAGETVAHMRESAPMVMVGLEEKPEMKNQGFALFPVLRRSVATVMYGEGGSCKSLMAIYFSMLVQGGFDANGLKATPGNILYCDWETDEDDFTQRLFAIQEGDANLEGVAIAYRHCSQPFLAELEQIAAIVTEHKVDMIVIDSFEAALAKNSNDSEQIQPFFNALRNLVPGGVTALLIDHKSKSDAERNNSSGPMGSVMKLNRARSVWEVAQGEDGTVGLLHKKVNTGRKHPPMGFDISFTGEDALERVRFTRTDISMSDLRPKLSVRDRVFSTLRKGERSLDDLVAETGDDRQQIDNVLNRKTGKPSAFQKNANGKWGLSQIRV